MLNINKKYRTREGKPARILCTDLKSEYSQYPVVVAVTNSDGEEIIVQYSLNGNFNDSGSKSNQDLIECTPWDDIKVDDPVLVRFFGTDWQKRHFAGINSEGNPTTWKEGKTSWTTKNRNSVCAWDECKKEDY